MFEDTCFMQIAFDRLVADFYDENYLKICIHHAQKKKI